jgi:hypothetical protein
MGTTMSSQTDSDFMQNQIGLVASLKRWKDAFDNLLERQPDCCTHWNLALLTVQYESALHYASGLVEATETYWDGQLSQFQRILDLSEFVLAANTDIQAPASNPLAPPRFRCRLEHGVVPALFYVAWKCRHARTRLRAIKLLEQYPRIEGIWDSSICAHVAQFIDRVERGADALQHAAARDDAANAISESARVQVIASSFNMDLRKAQVGLMPMASNLSYWQEEEWDS